MSASGTNGTPAADSPAIPRFTSDALFAGARELCIVHAGQDYRLRITINDKLILTK